MKNKLYFEYNIPGVTFIGTKPEEIIRTIEYYKFQRGESWADIDVPSRDKLRKLEEINITCAFPFAKIDHNIEVRVKPNFIFWVNANAFKYMQKVAASYEELRRGELYKFCTINLFGLWFLPKEIMEGLRDYNWSQHQQQINEWLNEREKDLNELQMRGMLLRKRG